MPKRNDKRDTAKAEYIKRRRSGEKVNLKDLAEKLGVTYGTVRNWKRIDQWDDAVERKRGGQPGNKNSRGKRNAKGNPGGGAPNGNTNAEKDGAYSTVHLERLSQEERDWLDQMPTGANENNIYELKLLRIQQRHIMERIAEYESCDPEKLFTASITDMRKPGKDKDGKQADGAVQKMVMDIYEIHQQLKQKRKILTCRSAVENHLSLDKVNKVKKKPVSFLTLHKEYGIVI